MECPIWETPIRVIHFDSSSGLKCYSPRAGGEYRITKDAIEDNGRLKLSERAAITTWLVDERRRGNKSPLINNENISEIKSREPLKLSEIRDRFFGFFVGSRPGKRFPFSNHSVGSVGYTETPQKILAQMGVESFAEGEAII